MRWGVYFDLSWGGLHQHGLNNNTMGVFGIKPVTNYAGGLAINRYASINEAVYCNITNSVFSGGDSIAVALPNASLYFDARNTPTGTDGFSTANLSAGAIGQNFVDADIKQLMTDVGNFEANLNR